MPRHLVDPDHALLVRVLRDPEALGALPPPAFARVLDAAEQARLLGWVVSQVDAQPRRTDLPAWLEDRIATARTTAREYERALRWETGRVQRAFHETGIRWVLLKGAAYVAARLPPGLGRKVADIDVLVPREQLEPAESALRGHGWVSKAVDAYDEHYYRAWMHELPPLVHGERRSVIDLHHGILPRTSRLRPDPRLLIDRAVRADEQGVRVLCPTHMVLHAAAHLFHDGEVAGAIRDLVDLDALLRHFGEADRGFWGTLVSDAGALGLERPAYYAVRYAERMLGTPVPADVRETIVSWGPPGTVRALMDALVERALQPDKTAGGAAALVLLVRSQWLRMPPALLVRHLAHKARHFGT